MTSKLDEAFADARKLPADAQDMLATIILAHCGTYWRFMIGRYAGPAVPVRSDHE